MSYPEIVQVGKTKTCHREIPKTARRSDNFTRKDSKLGIVSQRSLLFIKVSTTNLNNIPVTMHGLQNDLALKKISLNLATIFLMLITSAKKSPAVE